MDCAVDAPTAEQGAVGGVDDSVNVLLCNIAEVKCDTSRVSLRHDHSLYLAQQRSETKKRLHRLPHPASTIEENPLTFVQSSGAPRHLKGMLKFSDSGSPRQFDEAGISLLELAIFIPVLVLIVAGIIDYGFALREVQAISSASREGARIAASHARINRTYTESGGKRIYNNVPCVDPKSPLSSILCGAKSSGALTVEPSDPVANAAKKAACSSINNAGLNGAEWNVTASVPEVAEDWTTFDVVTVQIEKNPDAAKCLLCWNNLLEAFRARSESTFVLEAECQR